MSSLQKRNVIPTTQAIRSREIPIRSNGSGYPLEKIVIRSNGSLLFQTTFTRAVYDEPVKKCKLK